LQAEAAQGKVLTNYEPLVVYPGLEESTIN